MTDGAAVEVREKLHFVGIGGMGMAPLALYLKGLGYRISGEDKQLTPEVERWLVTAGVELGEGGLPEEAERLVISSAVGRDHPRVVEADRRGLPIVRRGEMLAEAVREKKLIAVVGSHGKTTTTAMLIHSLRECGFEFGYVLGGLFNGDVPPAVSGAGDWVVAEIDESDGTIGSFTPEITVCVNVDWDHCDLYREKVAIEETFQALKERTRSVIFYNAGCPVSARLFSGDRSGKTVSFGNEGSFELDGTYPDTGFQRLRLGGRFGSREVLLNADGPFNAQNACAALAVVTHLGMEPRPDLLKHYPGVRRRQGILYQSSRVAVMEDYAHHPAEIEALLRTLRPRAAGRMVVVFQPHRYTRTAQFRDDFARVLCLADRLFLLEVYAASERPLAGGTTGAIAEILRSREGSPPFAFPDSFEQARREIVADVRDGDQVLFVGAGDIERLARDVAGDLREREHSDASARLENELSVQISPATVVRHDEPLGSKTTLRVGGKARFYAEPATKNDLVELLRAAKRRKLPVLLLGRGSNLIVPDEGVPGLVVRLQHANWQRFERRPDGLFEAGAGLRLKELCGLAARDGYQGFEFLEGIPGTVGGGLRMNAGAMGGWFIDVVESVEIMTANGDIQTLRKEQLHFGYRHCDELESGIALSAVLRPASRDETESIRSRIRAFQKQRQSSQPREPSAGCIFKNPDGGSAGQIIDELGLKGTRIGDAEISPVHANFIINRGHATSSQVIELVRTVRERVRTERSIDLEPEVLLYGKEWKEVL